MAIIDFKTREEIIKGWSSDKKYCVTTSSGEKYLLRISNLEQQQAKEDELEILKQVFKLGIPMCKPIDFEVCEDGVCLWQSWIEGRDFLEVVTDYTTKEQYDYGIEAGKVLRMIHTIPAPESQEEWSTRFNSKIDIKVKRYEECSLKYENGQCFIDYINENRNLLQNRPQCYQHGDYHVGNMMVDDEGKLQIIDFDRNDYGDPFEEFNSIVWSAHISPSFATGMVNGYFNDNVPMDFWRLLALYISCNSISSLPWAIPFGQSEVDTMIKQAEEVLDWYDDMRNPVPTWYRGGKF